MMIIAGTVPDARLPLVAGPVRREGSNLAADGHSFPRIQGTGAMISAALATTEYLGMEPPFIVVAGDIGKGDGTKLIYRYLTQEVAGLSPDMLTLHYCQPFMNLLRQLVQEIDRMVKPPVLMADAGAMYAAKAAGLASRFDVFTPDPSEIAFLADPNATHPAYIGRHLFDSCNEDVPGLIDAAYANGSAARVLIVKGATDYIAEDGQIKATISEPDVPVLEAIGGTGDTITGLTSSLIYSGVTLVEAGILAAKTNRMAGQEINPTPATRVYQLIDAFPEIFKKYLCEWSGICTVSIEGGT
jgi:NAD(P)H-hydrate repair Nnr-like enzyme with NAD(P)H-hydrate dehydratase domain